MVLITDYFSPSLMDKYYLVRASMYQYAWFNNFKDANDFLFNQDWLDTRFATNVFSPSN